MPGQTFCLESVINLLTAGAQRETGQLIYKTDGFLSENKKVLKFLTIPKTLNLKQI